MQLGKGSCKQLGTENKIQYVNACERENCLNTDDELCRLFFSDTKHLNKQPTSPIQHISVRAEKKDETIWRVDVVTKQKFVKLFMWFRCDSCDRGKGTGYTPSIYLK